MKIDNALIEKVVKEVIGRLNAEKDEIKIPVGVSNRHIHLSREDLDILFGKGYELTKYRDLRQPGQYAARETVIVEGPKGKIESVRILGPTRSETQLEVSFTDARTLGIVAPVRESGKLENSAPITIIGPEGSVKKSEGAITALRHIHMTPDVAKRLGLKDKDIVKVETTGDRQVIFGNVLVRVSDNYALEMHVDTDEANAAGLANNDTVRIILD
ncbi:MAG: phosphate propanoyltransferase [Clostridiales bacterium]|nr:phosphate propanoyltransferase [Clostridiales bacterium]